MVLSAKSCCLTCRHKCSQPETAELARRSYSSTMQAPSSRIGRDGIAGPLNPYVHDPPSPLVGKEDEIPGYVTRFGAYVRLCLSMPQRCDEERCRVADVNSIRCELAPVVKRQMKSSTDAPAQDRGCLVRRPSLDVGLARADATACRRGRSTRKAAHSPCKRPSTLGSTSP